MALGLQISGVILLYFASVQMSWSMQTWSGKSKEEKVFRKRHLVMGIIGLVLVIVGMILFMVET